MKFETLVGGALIAAAILWNGHKDRAYQSAAIDRCAAAFVELKTLTPETARTACLMKQVGLR
jgi:hypothetical protein